MSDAKNLPSLDQLEVILNNDGDAPIEILPDGEMVRVTGRWSDPVKPVTLNRDLGSEYGQSA